MIGVASVPASHVYVRHLADPRDGDVVRLPDPVPADGRKVPGGWWPPLMLDPVWIGRHSGEFDVFHIHFGFDAIDPAAMSDIVHELSLRRVPLVYTVHDLRNPHHHDPVPHRQVLDVLIPAADEVITLTPGAAARHRVELEPAGTGPASSPRGRTRPDSNGRVGSATSSWSVCT